MEETEKKYKKHQKKKRKWRSSIQIVFQVSAPGKNISAASFGSDRSGTLPSSPGFTQKSIGHSRGAHKFGKGGWGFFGSMTPQNACPVWCDRFEQSAGWPRQSGLSPVICRPAQIRNVTYIFLSSLHDPASVQRYYASRQFTASLRARDCRSSMRIRCYMTLEEISSPSINVRLQEHTALSECLARPCQLTYLIPRSLWMGCSDLWVSWTSHRAGRDHKLTRVRRMLRRQRRPSDHQATPETDTSEYRGIRPTEPPTLAYRSLKSCVDEIKKQFPVKVSWKCLLLI